MKKTIVIFSGAGLSAESGIPTFRDSNGLWENHRVEDVASQDGWIANKELVLNFYRERYIGVKKCSPNEAHLAIASLQEKYDVINITQNIDDMLERAGCTNVIHLHGSINKKKCERHKEISNLDGDMNFTCTYKTDLVSPVALGELCECGGQLRPDVVWFGEAVDIDYKMIKKLNIEMSRNDGVFICIGTSAQVYPAAGLIQAFGTVKKKYIIDKNPMTIMGFTSLVGNASSEMKALATSLLS